MAHRFYVPGTRRFGGTTVTLAERCEDGGTLAEPVDIRGITIPAGSKLLVDIDLDDITVTLSETTPIRGHSLPAGTALKFPGRVFAFPGLSIPLWALPLLPVLMLRQRAAGHDLWVMPARDIVVGGRQRKAQNYFLIARDGSVRPLR